MPSILMGNGAVYANSTELEPPLHGAFYDACCFSDILCMRD